MTSDDLLTHIAATLAAGVVLFTSGATGLLATTIQTVAAQIPDGYLFALAASALAAGTAMFAWTFKLILQMRDSITELRTETKALTKDVSDLEGRVRDTERRQTDGRERSR